MPGSEVEPRGEALAVGVRSGIAFGGGARLVRQVLDFGTSLALMRLLAPSDFGVAAVAMAFLQITWVVGTLGVGVAVVQAERMEKEERDTAWWIATGTAGILTVVFVALSPALAVAFKMPQLGSIMPVLSLQFLIAGLVAVPTALLRRRLHFRRLALYDVVSSVVLAVVSITLAVLGFGVWSLVWGPVAGSATGMVLSYFLAGYAPGLAASRQAAGGLLRFGSTIAVKNVLLYLCRNADTFFVARLLGETATGFYSRSYNYAAMADQRLAPVFHEAFFPAFCRVKDDLAEFRRWYLSAQMVVAAVTLPACLGLMAVGEEFVVGLFDAKWEPSVPSLRILAIAVACLVLQRMSVAAIEASGALRWEVVPQAIFVVTVVVGSWWGTRYGIEGVACAVLCSAAVLLVCKLLGIRNILGLSIRQQLGPLVAPLFASLAMAILVRLLLDYLPLVRDQSHLLRLFVGVALGVLSYTILLRVIAPQTFERLRRQARLSGRGA